MAETLAEGPIQSILNVYVEDQPLVCISEQDFGVRGGSSDAVDVVCYGRADKGQVLLGSPSVGAGFNTSNGYILNEAVAYEDAERELERTVQYAQDVSNALTGKGMAMLGTSWSLPAVVSTARLRS